MSVIVGAEVSFKPVNNNQPKRYTSEKVRKDKRILQAYRWSARLKTISFFFLILFNLFLLERRQRKITTNNREQLCVVSQSPIVWRNVVLGIVRTTAEHKSKFAICNIIRNVTTARVVAWSPCGTRTKWFVTVLIVTIIRLKEGSVSSEPVSIKITHTGHIEGTERHLDCVPSCEKN